MVALGFGGYNHHNLARTFADAPNTNHNNRHMSSQSRSTSVFSDQQAHTAASQDPRPQGGKVPLSESMMTEIFSVFYLPLCNRQCSPHVVYTPWNRSAAPLEHRIPLACTSLVCYYNSVCGVKLILWIWYFDRQGSIQTKGINIVDDFPSFLVLLYAFQRLRLEQFGLNPRLDDQVRHTHSYPDPNNNGPAEWPVTIGTQELQFKSPAIYSKLLWKGGATVVVKAQDPITSQEYAVKIYWPEENRPHEASIISEARGAAGNQLDITNHLPQVISTEDFPYNTGSIRRMVGLTPWEAGQEGHRQSQVLRVIVFGILQPITALEGDAFVRAWLQCVRCERFQIIFLPSRRNH